MTSSPPIEERSSPQKSKTRSKLLSEAIKQNCTKIKSSNYYFDMFEADPPYPLKLLIPDTILFTNGSLSYWFRTNAEGELYKLPIESGYLFLVASHNCHDNTS